MVKKLLDECVLEHIADFRLTMKVVLLRRFFRGDGPLDDQKALRDVDTTIRRLKEKGYIHPVQGGIGKYSYYVLLPKGAHAIRRPKSAACKVNPETGEVSFRGLNRRVSQLWYCNMGETVRYLLSPKLFYTVLGKARADQLDHALERRGGEDSAVLRFYVPGKDTPVPEICRQLELEWSKNKEAPILSWMNAQRYRVQVLVPHRERIGAITSHARSQGVRCPFEVSHVPNAETLTEFLAEAD